MDKTKTRTLNGKLCDIVLKGSIVEQVDTFQYQAPMITEDAECNRYRVISADVSRDD